MSDDHHAYTRELLQITLSAAVPLRIAELQRRPWNSVDAQRADAIEQISAHGDNILYPGKKKGDTAKAFNALALAVAILSFMPGGITTFGLTFEAQHPELKGPDDPERS